MNIWKIRNNYLRKYAMRLEKKYVSNQIKNPDNLQQLQNHPGFCVCVTVAYGGQNESVNLTEILTRLVERHCIWQKESFPACQN